MDIFRNPISIAEDLLKYFFRNLIAFELWAIVVFLILCVIAFVVVVGGEEERKRNNKEREEKEKVKELEKEKEKKENKEREEKEKIKELEKENKEQEKKRKIENLVKRGSNNFDYEDPRFIISEGIREATDRSDKAYHILENAYVSIGLSYIAKVLKNHSSILHYNLDNKSSYSDASSISYDPSKTILSKLCSNLESRHTYVCGVNYKRNTYIFYIVPKESNYNNAELFIFFNNELVLHNKQCIYAETPINESQYNLFFNCGYTIEKVKLSSKWVPNIIEIAMVMEEVDSARHEKFLENTGDFALEESKKNIDFGDYEN